MINTAMMNAATEGVALATWPLRMVVRFIKSLIKTALYTLGGALVLFCGVLWVLCHFVMRIAGTPVDWSDSNSFVTGAALMASYALIALFTFIGIWSVGMSWVSYRKHEKKYHFGEGFAAGLIGAIYGLFGTVLALFLYCPGFCNWNLGPTITVLTILALLPVVISAVAQDKFWVVLAS